MKKFSKALSLLLAVCMIMGTFSIVFADEESTEVTLSEKVFDLDLTNFASTSTAGANGAVNAGTSDSATIKMYNWKYATSVDAINLTKNAMTTNSGDRTDYVTYQTNGTWTTTSTAFMSDTKWEETDTTFSFWITSNQIKNSVAIAAYNLIYTDESSNTTKKGISIWDISNTRWNTSDATGDVAVNADWNHVAIVNKKADAEGKKNFDLYVNGTFYKTLTVTIPTNLTLTENSLSFGTDRYGATTSTQRLGRTDFGKVQAYTGALSAEQIAYLHESQQSDFVPLDVATAPKLFDLDLTNFSATSTAGANGAENAGTSQTAEITLYNYNSGNGSKTTSTKTQMTNANGGITDYIAHSMTWNGKEGSKAFISDNAWEDDDTTISFWLTPNTSGDAKVMASYNLTYVDGEGAETTVAVPIWRVTSLGFNTGYDTANCATMKKDEFNHIALVNKKVDASGNKTVDVYINGAFYKTVPLTQPAGTTLKSAVLSFGEKYPSGAESYDVHGGTFNYGKVQVYKGAYLAGDIKSLYELQKPELTAVTLSEAEKLLDLNVDNFVTTTTAGSSGITNAGTSTTANLDIYSTTQVKVEKQFLMNSDLTVAKPYIYMYHNNPLYISSGSVLNNHFDVSDTEWVKQPVTISFWADLDRSPQQMAAQQYCWIATYNVDYKNSDGSTGNKETGIGQTSLDLTNSYNWNIGSIWPNSGNPFTMNNSKEWTHVAYVVSNNRNVTMYINGAKKGTITLDIPADAVATKGTLRFGGDRANRYMPGDLSIVDVKVYKGQFTSDLVKEIYDAEKAAYAEPGEAKVRFYKTDEKGTDTEIYKLNDIANDGTGAIKIKYTETIDAAYKLIVVAYDANMEFISANGYDYDAESTGAEFKYNIPENTKYIETFVWEGESLAPIQKKYYIQYNN